MATTPNQKGRNGLIITDKFYYTYVKCPGNILYNNYECPIPECPAGFEPVPYHCKFKEELLVGSNLQVEKNPGEKMGVKLVVDREYEFILNTTVKVRVEDSYSGKEVAIKEIKLITTQLNPDEVKRLLQTVTSNSTNLENVAVNNKPKNMNEI